MKVSSRNAISSTAKYMKYKRKTGRHKTSIKKSKQYQIDSLGEVAFIVTVLLTI